MQQPHPPASRADERCRYVDWLRFFAVLGVFVLHTAEPFTPYGTVKNDPTSMALTVFAAFFFFWIMPFFFLLAGAGQSSPWKFGRHRNFSRKDSFDWLSRMWPAFSLSFPQWRISPASAVLKWMVRILPTIRGFFRNLEFGGGLNFLHRVGAHLWFLPFLFLVSLLALNLLLYLRTHSGQGLVRKQPPFASDMAC